MSRRLLPSLNGAGLFRFALRWDAPGPADLSGWNRPIAGEADRLRIGEDGRLYRGGERIRLFGFNFSSGAALMGADAAERVAARLARLGVNYVRIAQHSNRAPDGWLDPVTAGRVDAGALERLDDFLAALGRHGIYVHLVLNHFRRAYPPDIVGVHVGPGLPAGWPPLGTGVTQFFAPVIAHNRAVARELLTHRNRQNGLSYADDPTIAVVEVTNEDGLVAAWSEGALDGIIAAGGSHLNPLRGELRERWNRWLRSRYATDAAVQNVWAAGASPGGAELLTDGDFRRPAHAWRFETDKAGPATFRVMDRGGPRGPAAEIQLAPRGVERWPAILAHEAARVVPNRPYRISLWARASRPGIRLCAWLDSSPGCGRAHVSNRVEWTVTDEWKRYIGRLTAGAEEHTTLTLGFGSGRGNVSVAHVSLREEPVSGLRRDERASTGTVPPLSRAGFTLRTPPAQRDWIAFLVETECEFFADAFHFLRHDLGVRALVVGTQADRSPAAAQSAADITSMHAYWGHPSFPGRPWDAAHWFAMNRSMVNARDEWHTLNRIAFRRRRGRALIVDEYNHPQPNTFGAEGFPLAAAYAAFQDWDGIAGWAYREGGGAGCESPAPRPHRADHMIRDHFALDTDPVRLLSAWLAAVILRRGDVSPGRELVSVFDGPEEEIARTVGLSFKHEVVGRGAHMLPLLHRVALDGGAAPAPPERAAEGAPLAGDTGELVWETGATGGVVVLNTPRTKAVIGFGAGREFSLGNVIIRPGPTAQRGFGIWAVTALDGLLPIEKARRLIIVALGYSQNTNQEWTIFPDRRLAAGPPQEGAAVTLGSAWGGPPTLAEGVPARITLRGTCRVRMWRLDETAQRGREVPVHAERDVTVLELRRHHRTLWYEVSAVDDGD